MSEAPGEPRETPAASDAVRLCPTHQVPATGACARCGDLACGACSASGGPLCARCAPPAPAPLPFLLRTWWASGALFFAGLVFFFLVGQILPGVVIGLLIGLRDGFQTLSNQQALEAKLIPYLPLLIAFSPLAALVMVGGLKASRQLADDPPPTSWGFTGVFTVVTCAAAMGGAMGIAHWQQWLGIEVQEQEIMAKAMKGGASLGMALAIVVFAPVGEELFFRRFAYSTLRVCYGRVFALIVTATLFAVIHLNPPALPIYFWLGLCCAFAYEKTGSISSAIAVHAVNNAIALAGNS